MRFGGLQHHLQQYHPQHAAGAAAAAGPAGPASPAAELAVFLLESEGTSSPGGSMFLEVVPSFSSMVFRCGEGCVLEACSTSSSSTTSSSSRSSSSRGSSSSRPSSCNHQLQQQQQAQQLQSLFFPESRRDVKPRGSMFLEVVPSFSSMVFRCGEGCALEACSTTSSSTTRSMQQEQQQQQQQQQQAQQLNSLCFY